jgi:hypothetical protein
MIGIREMYQIHAAPRGQVLAKTRDEFNRWRIKHPNAIVNAYHSVTPFVATSAVAPTTSSSFTT